MAEVAPAAPPKATKTKTSKPKPAGLKLKQLICEAVAASKDKKGVSYVALKRALTDKGIDVEKNKVRIRTSIRKLLADGTLLQNKGVSGSFKIGKAEKPAARARKPAAKKPAAAKKPKAAAAVKKSGAQKKSSPKKAKKPAATAAKKAKAAKSPKKAQKKAAAKKAPAAKKSPAKKTVKPKAKKVAAKKK